MTYSDRIASIADKNLESVSGRGLVKNSDHYLVFRRKCSWDNMSAIDIVESIDRVFSRGYDCTILAVESYRSGKMLECCEYHHDKPQGHRSFVVALNKSEYSMLERNMYDSEKYLATVYRIIKSYLKEV